MPYTKKNIYKNVRYTSYDEKNIPEKNYLPIYKRIKNGRIYYIKGVENMWQVCRVCNKLKHEKDFPVHSEIDKYARRQLRNICRGCHNDNRKLLIKLKVKRN